MSYRVVLDEEFENQERAKEVYQQAIFLVQWARRLDPRPVPLRVRLLRETPEGSGAWLLLREEISQQPAQNLGEAGGEPG